MNIPIYQVDAFANKVFTGNPAAVCFFETWPEDEIMQNIAAENNLAETAFLIKQKNNYVLRWFTPEVEMDLCGHATLASAYVIFNFIQQSLDEVEFETKSGILTVKKSGDLLSMDFPSRVPIRTKSSILLEEALGVKPVEVWKSRDLLVILDDEKAVQKLRPDFEKMKLIEDSFAVIVSSKGDSVDFVSRFFAPNAGIPEDPVTGSAHCTLVPYWAERLGKNKLHAGQLSKRGGELFCELVENRVVISGYASLFLKGTIYL